MSKYIDLLVFRKGKLPFYLTRNGLSDRMIEETITRLEDTRLYIPLAKVWSEDERIIALSSVADGTTIELDLPLNETEQENLAEIREKHKYAEQFIYLECNHFIPCDPWGRVDTEFIHHCEELLERDPSLEGTRINLYQMMEKDKTQLWRIPTEDNYVLVDEEVYMAMGVKNNHNRGYTGAITSTPIPSSLADYLQETLIHKL